MDDLAGKLNEILNSPEGMQQVQELAGMLGLGNPPAAPAPAPPALPTAGVTPELLGMVSRLAPLMSTLQQEDDTTRLLQALRPLLSEARRPRVDRALQLMKMLRVLPTLQESGALSSLLQMF